MSLMLFAGCGEQVTGGADSQLELLPAQCAELQFSGPITATVAWTAGSSSLQVEGSASALERLEVERGTEDARLVLSAAAPVTVMLTCEDRAPVSVTALDRARVKVENLPARQLRAYGVSALSYNGSTEDVDVRASGGATLDLELEAMTITLLASGGSRATLTGVADRLVVDAGGKARVAADALRAQDVTAKAAGESEVLVWPSAHLRTSEREAGRVRSRGEIPAQPLESDG